MPLTELNHYFIRANDLERTKQFYCDVLGFEVMPRPNFPFPGYWLGVNGAVQVHMGPHGIPHSEVYYLGTTPESTTKNSGVVDHIAFLATDPETFAKHFAARGIVPVNRYLPEFQLYPDVHQRPQRAHHRIEFLRRRVGARVGRSELRRDAARWRDPTR